MRGIWGLMCAIGVLAEGCAMMEDSLDARPVILGGQVHTGDPAVVLIDLGNGICTGTLIAPKVVLTAAHCLNPTPTTLTARFVNAETEQGPSISGVDPTIIPNTDQAVFALAQAGPVAPVPYNTTALEAYVG